MSIHLPRAGRTAVETEWAEWGARVYGTPEQWKNKKAQYWASRWTVFRRCVVCRAGRSKDGRPLELNHLTYWPTKLRRGWVPLLFLVPLCHRCHVVETRFTRWLRRRKVNFGEHVIATLCLYLAPRSVLVSVAWTLWHFGPW